VNKKIIGAYCSQEQKPKHSIDRNNVRGVTEPEKDHHFVVKPNAKAVLQLLKKGTTSDADGQATSLADAGKLTRGGARTNSAAVN